MKHGVKKVAYGDFQTPIELAQQCCSAAADQIPSPSLIIEPTCGKGAFVVAAAEEFPYAEVQGYEINAAYLRAARTAVRKTFADHRSIAIKKQDFFAADWQSIADQNHDSILFLGNPPWVTNSQLGALGSGNLPKKSNVDRVRGIDAVTGRSNFDISESILTTLLDVARPGRDTIAMLVKTATARKVLANSWRRGSVFDHASIRMIDAKTSFNVFVEACLLVLSPGEPKKTKRPMQQCKSSPTIESKPRKIAMGWHNDCLVANARLAKKTQALCFEGSGDQELVWRSGIKHDVSAVVELSHIDGKIVRQDGGVIKVEPEVLFPLAKGADVANNRRDCATRRMLVPQRSLSEPSARLKHSYPNAYKYLTKNRSQFAARKSTIYRDRDPFALFGVGPYTFQPWKIAICGMYKRLQFTLLGPVDGQPVVTDDTCYSLSFTKHSHAKLILAMLQTDTAQNFFEARIFWDAKRPITAKLLRQLDLRKLAKTLGHVQKYDVFFRPN